MLYHRERKSRARTLHLSHLQLVHLHCSSHPQSLLEAHPQLPVSSDGMAMVFGIKKSLYEAWAAQ